MKLDQKWIEYVIGMNHKKIRAIGQTLHEGTLWKTAASSVNLVKLFKTLTLGQITEEKLV